MKVSKAGLAGVTLAILVSFIPAAMVLSAQRAFGSISDLPNYYAAAKMITQGQGPCIYITQELGRWENQLYPSMESRVVAFYVPPFAVPWLLPLAALPPAAAIVAWLSLLLLALVAAYLLLVRHFALPLRQAVWAWIFLALSGPAYEALRIGQLSPLLLLSLVLAIVALQGNRPLFAGVSLSFMLVKPQMLLPFAFYLLGCARYRVLLVLAAAGLVLLGISWLLLGQQGFLNYFELMAGTMKDPGAMQPDLQPTVRGQLLRLFPLAPAAVTAAGAVTMLLSLGISFLLGRRLAMRPDWLNSGVMAIMPLGLATAFYCHDYDLLLLLPSVMALGRSEAFSRLPEAVKLAAVFSTLFFLLPFYIYIHYEYLLKGAPLNPLFGLLSVLACLLVIRVYKRPA